MAEEAVALAEQQLEAAKILEERAIDELQQVRQQVLEEAAVLEAANAQRAELLAQVIAADDKNTLMQIEKEAQFFADQNAVFREVGSQIVVGVSSAINAQLSFLQAQAALGAATGHIPNIRNMASGSNLSPGEAAGLLKAAMREKRAMPGGSRLAVANTSEAIIPMNKAGGYIPNFQSGNESPISAGINAIKGINESVVAAISRSISTSLADIGGPGGDDQAEILRDISGTLANVRSELEDIAASNLSISSSSAATAAEVAGDAAGAAGGMGGGQEVNINLQTNQNSAISITGLDNLVDNIREAVRDAAIEQADSQILPLLTELESIVQVLRERGLLSSFGQPG
jgi:hypothetical protein